MCPYVKSRQFTKTKNKTWAQITQHKCFQFQLEQKIQKKNFKKLGDPVFSESTAL